MIPTGPEETDLQYLSGFAKTIWSITLNEEYFLLLIAWIQADLSDASLLQHKVLLHK